MYKKPKKMMGGGYTGKPTMSMRGGGLDRELAQMGNEVDISERLREMARAQADKDSLHGMPRQTAAVGQELPKQQTRVG